MDSKLDDIFASTPEYSRKELNQARGDFIDAYSEFEHHMVNTFAHAFKGPDEFEIGNRRLVTAAFVFSKIVNTRSRSQILERVMRDAANGKFSVFRKSLFKQVSTVDDFRNKVAHGRAISRSNGTKNVIMLISDHREFAPITIPMIRHEIERITSLRIIWQAWNLYNEGESFGGIGLDTSIEIFQQPVVHPLPEDHPISRWQRESASRPR